MLGEFHVYLNLEKFGNVRFVNGKFSNGIFDNEKFVKFDNVGKFDNYEIKVKLNLGSVL